MFPFTFFSTLTSHSQFMFVFLDMVCELTVKMSLAVEQTCVSVSCVYVCF